MMRSENIDEKKSMSRASIRERLPSHLRRPLGNPKDLHEVKKLVRELGLHTVCESARCPNIGECFSKPTATFMILGNRCTRTCGFCGVDKTKQPAAIDLNEPENVAKAAKILCLRHVVVTSVTRDDLPDGGATHFAMCIRKIRETAPQAAIEVLTPDFKGSRDALKTVFKERPDIFNHNVETVARLYTSVRPEADYQRSIGVLSLSKEHGLFTKSGIMLGLGETADEVKETLRDLKEAGCDAITIGQYLKPANSNLDVKEYVSQEVFKGYEVFARNIGIRYIYSGPFIRSSYNAEEAFKQAVKG